MTKARQPGTLPLDFFADATHEVKETFRGLLREAGIRVRTEDGRIAFRSDPSPPPMVTIKALQRKDDGAIRSDAVETLRAADLLSDADASETAEMMKKLYSDFIPDLSGNAKKILPTSFDVLQMELLWNTEEMPILERWIGEWGPGVRLFRVATMRTLHQRDMFWRIATAYLEEGLTLQTMVDEGRWPKMNQVSGNVVAQAAFWLVAPMAARVQPFAAAFSTVRGAELVAIPSGAWDRDVYQPLLWPVGFGGLRLGGSGENAYARDGSLKIPASVAGGFLNQQLEGVNRLMSALTDPGTWAKGTDRELDVEERNIAWSTVNLGISAIRNMAEIWGTDESTWTAFRALSILAGFWTPSGGDEVKIKTLLTPSIVRDYAVPAVQPDWLRTWIDDAVVSNWERVLSEMFPDSSHVEAAGAVQELRNLIHGTGATPTGSRARGARLLAFSSTGRANLQIVRDITTTWWTALVQSPETHAIAGVPPF